MAAVLPLPEATVAGIAQFCAILKEAAGTVERSSARSGKDNIVEEKPILFVVILSFRLGPPKVAQTLIRFF